MPTESSRAEDEALVRKVLDDRAQAIRDKHADAVLAHYTGDLRVFELAASRTRTVSVDLEP